MASSVLREVPLVREGRRKTEREGGTVSTTGSTLS